MVSREISSKIRPLVTTNCKFWRVIIIIIGVDYDSFHDAVHLVLSTHVLFFHSFNMSANSSPLFQCHSEEILLCQLLNISQLKSNILLQLFWSSQYPKFFVWGLNQGGREAVWSLCVHAQRANSQLQKSHIAVYAFLRDRTALLLSCRSCTIYHAYPTRTAFHLFWHCWLGAGWAVYCGKTHCRPK